MEYAGSGTDGLSFERAAISSGGFACAGMPERLALRCRTEPLEVLTKGAVLVRGRKGPDDRIAPARWSPPSRTRIDALVCEIVAEGDAGPRLLPALHGEWRLAFAEQSVEWADENSDMSAQAGDYRFMAP